MCYVDAVREHTERRNHASSVQRRDSRLERIAHTFVNLAISCSRRFGHISLIAFPKKFAQNGFGLGVAIGLILAIHLTPFVRAAENTGGDATPCVEILDAPPEVQEYANLQCQVNTALFDGGLEPTVVYTMDTPVTQPGTYSGQTYDGRTIALNAVFVVELDLENAAPDLAGQGVSGYLVVARMTGSAGSVQIAGVVIETGSLTLDEQPILIISNVLSDEDYAAFADLTRIAGGVRVVDTSTLTIEPLSSVDSAESAWVSGKDPATIFTGAVVNRGGAVDVQCVQQAYTNYQIDADAAAWRAGICVAEAMGIWAICMAACIATFAWGGVNFPGTAICVLSCLAVAAIASARCFADLAVDMRAARQRLMNALLACGVTIV
ncbi:MAG TPA: hypothetical protein ENK11_02280 [Phycisphaerales bacterium]|nr:hypothetical protein [Phycisphaerales bacterium]